MSTESRKRLAAKQSELMGALSERSTLPGFDENRLKITASTLIQKRERTVAKIRPDIVEKLAKQGQNYSELFETYAVLHPYPSAGAHTDAKQFLTFVRKQHSGYCPPFNLLRRQLN